MILLSYYDEEVEDYIDINNPTIVQITNCIKSRDTNFQSSLSLYVKPDETSRATKILDNGEKVSIPIRFTLSMERTIEIAIFFATYERLPEDAITHRSPEVNS